MSVTLEHSDGRTKEIEVGDGEQVTCPECGSENVEFHTLTRVLAGECVACFTTWSLGIQTEWEVADGDG